MLKTHAERLVELAYDAQRGVGGLNIVVRQLLAVELLGRRQRIGSRVGRAVKAGLLVGILAVAQALHRVELQEEFFVQSRGLAHVGGDHRIVLGRVGICLCRELQTGFDRGVSRGFDLADDTVVIGRIAHYRHVLIVLRRASQHRRAADIDILYGVLHRNVGFGDRLAERIEVHAHHVDELDAVLFQSLQVALVVAARQQTAVHLGM